MREKLNRLSAAPALNEAPGEWSLKMLEAKKLSVLRAKIQRLQKEAQEIENQSSKSISQASALIRDLRLSLSDWKQAWKLAHGKAPASKAKTSRKVRKVPIKYSDDKGNKWSGRGRPPLWLVAAQKSGKKRDDFLVKIKSNGSSVH